MPEEPGIGSAARRKAEASRRRMRQLDDLLRDEVAKALIQEGIAPTGALVSVTRVHTSVDVAHATVYISVLPPQKADDVLVHLNEEIYGLQQRLNKRLHLKTVPKIRFEIDTSEEYAARIDQLMQDDTPTSNDKHTDDPPRQDSAE